MSNQLFHNPWPNAGKNYNQNLLELTGSVELYNSYPSGGEPLNWAAIVGGIPYNELNFLGQGPTATASAQVTALSASTGTITATATNNFTVGQKVTFIGCTTTLGLLLNGQTVTIVTCSSSQFTFTNAATGSGSSEVGIVYSGTSSGLVTYVPNPLNATLTGLSASGGVITATATNNFLPGAQVTFANCTTTLGLLLNGNTYTVTSATASAFKFSSASTGPGSGETGTVSGRNIGQPIFVQFQDCSATGYSFVYNPAVGAFHVQQGGASASNPNADISSGTYSSTLLNALIRYRAFFLKQ